jgi:hypothetical protein
MIGLLLIVCAAGEFSSNRVQSNPGFKFASYYMDHMVLQQAPQKAVIWGVFPDIGAKIIVKVCIEIFSYFKH